MTELAKSLHLRTLLANQAENISDVPPICNIPSLTSLINYLQFKNSVIAQTTELHLPGSNTAVNELSTICMTISIGNLIV